MAEGNSTAVILPDARLLDELMMARHARLPLTHHRGLSVLLRSTAWTSDRSIRKQDSDRGPACTQTCTYVLTSKALLSSPLTYAAACSSNQWHDHDHDQKRAVAGRMDAGRPLLAGQPAGHHHECLPAHTRATTQRSFAFCESCGTCCCWAVLLKRSERHLCLCPCELLRRMPRRDWDWERTTSYELNGRHRRLFFSPPFISLITECLSESESPRGTS